MAKVKGDGAIHLNLEPRTFLGQEEFLNKQEKKGGEEKARV